MIRHATSATLPEALAGLLPAQPGIHFLLEERYTADILHAVATSTADVGLVSGTVRAPELHLRSWRTDRLVVVLPRHHALTVRPSPSFAELDGAPFVAQPPEAALQKLCLHHAAADGIVLALRGCGFRASMGCVAILPAAVGCLTPGCCGSRPGHCWTSGRNDRSRSARATRRRSRLAARAFVEHLMAYGA